jgi:hypothetical protein
MRLLKYLKMTGVEKSIYFTAIAIILIFFGCEDDPRRIEQRLNSFRECIGPEAALLFDAGQDSACAAVIRRRLASDRQFAEAFGHLKSTEAIDLFTPEEVVGFYREYFAEVIRKENLESKTH